MMTSPGSSTCFGLPTSDTAIGAWIASTTPSYACDVSSTNAGQIIARVRLVEGNDERAIALRILAHVMATWHATPEDDVRPYIFLISE